MADGAQESLLRYSAFISYSSADVAVAKRLHRQLEMYRLPRRLVGKARSAQLRGRRLKPIFRDLADLSAEHDLTSAIREALAQSENLIVLCSPNSAKSEWVGREIEYFRALHGDGRIRAALIEGSAGTSFHPALLKKTRGAPVEPLAADFTKGGRGWRLGKLKLMAGLAGAQLDELIQRDAQRRMQVVVGLAVGVVVTLGVIIALMAVAMGASAEAEKQRRQATGLVDYMLTDLRAKAKRSGRLEELAAVNDGALRYYQNQDLSHLPEDALRQRAKLLQAMGEDDQKRGQIQRSRTEIQEAHRTTAALLAAKPNDPKRLFAHAQSEYWLGFINWRAGDGATARAKFEAYARLAQRLVEIEPNNADWQHEVAYSELNLGMLALRQEGDATTAETHFYRSFLKMGAIAQKNPSDVELQRDVIDALAWLADSQRVQRRYKAALDHRADQRRIIDRLLAEDPRNREVWMDFLNNELATARLEADLGRFRPALERLQNGLYVAHRMIHDDPQNIEIAKQARGFELFRIRTMLMLPRGERPRKNYIIRQLGDCNPSDSARIDHEIVNFCAALKERIANSYGGSNADATKSHSFDNMQIGEIYSARWGLHYSSEIQPDK
ncbi:toll/interleukin-1 receptor domain-containing protein [Phenylobacterium sp.]|uniref:toll/interleukin-1 receptor domain-containing protein n=1 Tax=Phenylobacterium sp. TaxID=1871053 RepID=UPI0025EF5F4A|nr:toll/interleukin-1 receptor domain-containing protein [Phenylobacterium sp.]